MIKKMKKTFSTILQILKIPILQGSFGQQPSIIQKEQIIMKTKNSFIASSYLVFCWESSMIN
jgi:hypothetical protein